MMLAMLQRITCARDTAVPMCRAKVNNTYLIVYKGASGVSMDGAWVL